LERGGAREDGGTWARQDTKRKWGTIHGIQFQGDARSEGAIFLSERKKKEKRTKIENGGGGYEKRKIMKKNSEGGLVSPHAKLREKKTGRTMAGGGD